jgi:hypothetical protein
MTTPTPTRCIWTDKETGERCQAESVDARGRWRRSYCEEHGLVFAFLAPGIRAVIEDLGKQGRAAIATEKDAA